MAEEVGSWVEAYAVVRWDDFQADDASIDSKITVKEVLPTLEEAEAEVDRLNALASDKGSTYFWQYTRYFPDGRHARLGY